MTRIAVPFFFCTSGYFLRKSYEQNGINAILLMLKRVIFLYSGLSVIYYFIIFIQAPALLFQSKKWMVYDFLFNGSYYHLWYMLGLCYGVAVIYIALRVHLEKTLFLISVVCYVIGLWGTAYYKTGIKMPLLRLLIDSEYFLSIRRIFLMGFPFLILGWTIFIREKKMQKVSTKRLFASFGIIVIGFVFEIISVTVLGISRSIEITLLLHPLVFVLFKLCLTFPASNINKLAQTSRFIANYTYYWHPLVIICLQRIRFLSNQLLFIAVSLVCFVTGYYICKLELLLRRTLDASDT